MTKKLKIIFFVLILLLVVISVVLVAKFPQKQNTQVTCNIPPEAVDHQDDREYGSATNVFTGKVLRQIGSEGNPEFPGSQYAQYEVEVLENKKGNLQSNVIFNLSMTAIDGGFPPLAIGSSYKIWSKFDQEKCWFTGVNNSSAL